MSFAQRRLWFLDQLEPGNPAYNCPIPIRLKGRLDLDALAKSLRAMVRQQEVLRTTYAIEDGIPVQVVHPGIDVPLTITDCTTLDRSDRESVVQQCILEDANRPFDLSVGPTIRTELIRVDADDHVLIVNIHHIANDAWSVSVFFQQLASLYNARAAGRSLELPELPIQYADYALWQRERLQGAFGKEQLSFWRERLAGFTPVDMPTDHPRPTVLSHRGALARLTLPSFLVSKLQEIGRAEGATLYMTLLAGLKVLLARYTGQTDIAVGTSATGRDRPELEELIGFFVNTIVLRTDLSDNPTFRELLQRVRTGALTAYAHSEFPFDLLVQELHPQRDASRNPLVPVMFILDETPEELPPMDGLTSALLEPEFTTAKFDLLINARPTHDGIYAHVQYSTDLFERDTIQRLIGHYRTILEATATEPDRRTSELAMLTESERRQILQEVNDTAAPFPRDSCLHELFEKNVASSNNGTAIIFGDQRLSYGDLDERARSLARRLQHLGVGPETRVAVCLDRSPEFVVAILAVLKAGGAYVPLDPTYPSDRLSFMLKDAETHAILTQKSLEAKFQEHSARILCVDAEEHDRAGEQEGIADNGVTSENLVYVIYTSGSTGCPKGILLQHRGVVNNLVDLNHCFDVGPEDRILFLSSPSFDMSVYETLGMLAAGGGIVIPDPVEAKDPVRWVDLMTSHEVTIWNSAPALLELLVEQLERKGGPILPSLRIALLGGDWIPVSLPDRLRAFAPATQFISLGGATEASIHSIVYPVERVDPNWKSIPYGLPMANQRAYILDRWLQPVPIGVPGELHLAGEGLARGYLGRTELTDERFIEHSFTDGKVERLYKTGDLARWHMKGDIELLGRMDSQVKIHGLRVEPGEIESVLLRHELVEDAVVVQRNDDKRGKYLAAYFVPRSEQEVSEGELRQHLAQVLPAYMIPVAFVSLDRLPTNPNGKIDRRALPTPEWGQRESDAVLGDEIEERVALAWRSTLGVEQFGNDDNFFELGGDSFKAIRAMRAIDDTLQVIELFKYPTVRSLAAHLRGVDRRTDCMLHRLGASKSARLSLVCIPYGGGNATAYQPLAERLPSHFAPWSVSLPGHDSSGSSEALISVEEAARHCADEIMERITEPLAVYGQCAGVAVAVELACHLEQRGVDLRAVYLGAALPDQDPEESLRLERASSDDELYSFLRTLGGFDGALELDDTARILQSVRHDLVQASKFFAKSYNSSRRRLSAVVRCLVGDRDPATEGFETRFREWEAFAASVELVVLPGAGHYFVKHQAVEVAEILAHYHPEEKRSSLERQGFEVIP